MPRRRPSIIPVIALMLTGARPAWAGEAVGPCSPFHAADGDIRSEMPGCARRLRPAPGSLDDELAFRRGRGAADEEVGPDDEPSPARRRRRR